MLGRNLGSNFDCWLGYWGFLSWFWFKGGVVRGWVGSEFVRVKGFRCWRK